MFDIKPIVDALLPLSGFPILQVALCIILFYGGKKLIQKGEKDAPAVQENKSPPQQMISVEMLLLMRNIERNTERTADYLEDIKEKIP